jgi:hypothetical protein
MCLVMEACAITKYLTVLYFARGSESIIRYAVETYIPMRTKPKEVHVNQRRNLISCAAGLCFHFTSLHVLRLTDMTKCQGIWYKTAGDILGSGSRALGGQWGRLDRLRGILIAIGSVSGDVGEGCGRCEQRRNVLSLPLHWIFICMSSRCLLRPASKFATINLLHMSKVTFDRNLMKV